MNRITNTKLVLAGILLFAALLRFYGLNWDSGHMLHPDERAIIMTVDKLKFPDSLSEFLSPESSWNPKFFAYGSFPMYALRVTGNILSVFDPQIGQYATITILGRALSALADLISAVLVFKIGRKLFNETVGLLASFFYTTAVLPIQLSHFFAVDTLLTCFVLATLYRLLVFYEKPSAKTAVFIGLFFGLCLATKISAVVLIISIVLALTADFILIFLSKPHKFKHWLPLMSGSIMRLLKYGVIILVVTLSTFTFFEPYALIDFQTFWAQTLSQSELTKNVFYFPYTLQFVGKIPYIYELKNLFFWGLGPVIATLSFAGAIYIIFKTFKSFYSSSDPPAGGESRSNNLTMKQFNNYFGSRQARTINPFAKELIIVTFFLVYFLIVGKFAVGFMRYMLPIYPLFTLFAAVLVYKLMGKVKSKPIVLTSYFLLLTSCLIWPLSFIQIYTKPNTRIGASNWIYDNIPGGKTLSIEHWDDQLPFGQPVTYQMQWLKLYDHDTKAKWDEINSQLVRTDYIIIASNRLYTPLQKLTNCKSLPPNNCYVQTAKYYQDLFSGNLGFKKVAEFTAYPKIPILNIMINDQGADENFTVFDHPKVMIFKKIWQ